ncbi:PAS domain S-box-containing protein [Larkinella arboricola]|uniref:histidine kinase n=1 Tax=Larkinella arboricola TaxID=643671 RepID=A0A327WPW3_LARAB|nr:PAS domain-containing sensor histidine kinase [Larkinella arboricola]RAJ93268.1 PAS domain S-box-containing protein [Larkinella arboricola]
MTPFLPHPSGSSHVLPLADDLPVMVWVTQADGACSYLNSRWYEYTGQQPQEALGTGWLRAVHSDDASQAGDVFFRANQAQQPFSLDYRLRAFDGTYRWMKDSGRPRFDDRGQFLGFVGSVVDIHELKIMQERLKMAVESTDLGTWDFDPRSGELIWSDRCKALFGLPADAAVDYSIFLQGIHPDDRASTDAVVQAVLQPGSLGYYDIEYRTVGITDGQLRWLRAKGQSFFDQDGQVNRFIGTVLDITSTKLANEILEQRVAQQTHQLQQINTELQRSNQNLQSFAYVASHDLQEPLRKIQAFGDILKGQYAAALGSGVDYLNRMQQAAGRMSVLIRDLLAFSRLSSTVAQPSLIALDDLLKSVLVDLELTITETGAQIRVHPLPTVMGDPTQLRQLFQNLLGNALKFRRPEVTPLIEITVSSVARQALPAEVKPLRASAGFHRIEVSDNGIGFDPKDAPRIFQVFQRLHGRSQYSGTGIGLAICESVVANHGGAITVHSRPGQGTAFQVYLPMD